MTQNQIAYWNYKESGRHNRAVEAETHRANRAQETETNRHNVTWEQETERHNRAIEGLTSVQNVETHRSNVVRESLQAEANAEIARNNRAKEALTHESNLVGFAQVGLGYSQLNEASRHNVVDEKNRQAQLLLNQQSIEEQARANQVNEQNQFLGMATGRQNANTAVLNYQESSRHNKRSENISIGTALTGVGGQAIRAAAPALIR